MTAPFECEVRFYLSDPEVFHRRLERLGARLQEAYAFTDHYYRPAQPAGSNWNGRSQALRIRQHHVPDSGNEVLLTHGDLSSAGGLPFKRSRFPEGKVRLYAGALADCRAIVESLGFAPWITVRKLEGRLIEVPDVGTLVTERIEGVGWMCEIEQGGGDVARAVEGLRSKLARLGVSIDQVTGEPVAALVASTSAASAAGRAAPSDRTVGRKVYFCGSIRGGRGRQPLYRKIVDFLQGLGYQVLTPHVADPDVLDRERREGVTDRDIYERDLRWLAESDLVIAEVSTPSLGVGVEIAEATGLGKPIIALCQAGVALSAMVAGNAALRVVTYADQADLLSTLAGELPGGRITARSCGDD